MRLLHPSILLTVLLSYLLVPAAQPVAARSVDLPDGYWQRWLRTVDPFLDENERRAFESLSDDTARERFRSAFWRARDPDPTTARNEARERFLGNLSFAQRESIRLDDRFLVTLLFGEPDFSFRLGGVPDSEPAGETPPCHPLRNLELFFYSLPPADRLSILFVPADDGRWLVWHPTEKDRSLERAVRNGCLYDYPHLWSYLKMAYREALEWSALLRRSSLPIARENWLAGFLESRSEASLSLEPPPELQLLRRVPDGYLVDLRWIVPVRLRTTAVAPFQAEVELVLEEMSRQTLRWEVHPAAAARQLSFVLPAPASTKSAVFRLYDLGGELLGRTVLPLDLAAMTAPASSPRASPSPSSAPSSEPPEGLPTAIQILPIPQPASGATPVEAVTAGSEIETVRFLLDGHPVGVVESPPFRVTLELDSPPRFQRLEAIGLSRTGTAVARADRYLNRGPNRFTLDVDLRDPLLGRPQVILELPEGESLDRLTFLVGTGEGEEPWVTLFQEPLLLPFAELPRSPSGEAATYLRAEAQLSGGRRAEAVEMLPGSGSGTTVDAVEVRLVELYATVQNRQGEAMPDLPSGLFRVRENGALQTLSRVEHVSDLSIFVAVLLDVSGSLSRELRLASRSAAGFFDSVLTDRDRGAVLVFSGSPAVSVPFTSNRAWLQSGLSELTSGGPTALYDSLITALRYFDGLTGKRALILLSDGLDQSSIYPFEIAKEFAIRSGVAVYTILFEGRESALNFGGFRGPGRYEAHRRLKRLARETGGLAFPMKKIDEIEEIYRLIENDLRSQYLLVYQAPAGGGEYREVDVEVERRGLEVKAPSGYFY